MALTRTEPNEKQNSLYDLRSIRAEAASSIAAGAVTPGYQLDLKRSCQILNDALASEIVCVLRYRHHQIVAKGIDFPQVAAEFAEHATEEERHMMMIGERIDQLGGDPDFSPLTILRRSATEYGSAGSLTAMIREDLVAERVVIEVYRKMIRYFGAEDPTTRRMLESILEDEEEHATDLADLLVTVDSTPRTH